MRFRRLTRLAIRKLGAGEKIAEHGIEFERLPHGDGRYTVNVMVDGQRVHRVIGKESAGVTRTQAEDFIEKARADARAGRLNLPQGRKLALGFRDAASRYLAKLEAGDGKDLKAKTWRLRLHLVPFFGDTALSKISGFDVERYKRQRLQEPASRGGDRVRQQAPRADATMSSPAAINRELAVLSHLFTKAVEWHWLDHKPATIKRLTEGRGRINYLTHEQIGKLIEAATHDQSPHIYLFIVIGLETSMRRMEILSIRLEHIDLQRRIIYIPKAKAGAREQPITSHLATFLAGYVAAAGQVWLFPTNRAGRTGHAVSIEKPFRRVVAAAGLDPAQVVRHTLRHTAITHLVQAGVDLPTVQRISGHKTLQMVVRYSHQNGAHIQAAMDKLDKRYRNAQ